VEPVLALSSKRDDLAGQPHANLELAQHEPADAVQGEEIAPGAEWHLLNAKYLILI
jgi:hypothetical protein